MKYIDIEHWERKDHFSWFRDMDHPHFSLCANVRITNFHAAIKKHNLPVMISMIYLASKVANSYEEFRLRIREDKVVVHERVHPSFTILSHNNVFSYCSVDYTEDFAAFCEQAKAKIAVLKESPSIRIETATRDDFLFMTSVPWISFTSLTHPLNLSTVDSIPRISWGKFFDQAGEMMMPLSIHAHHALMDGFHVGRYFNRFQELLDQASIVDNR